MYTRIVFTISFLLAFGSCMDEDAPQFNTCGVSDPVHELPWLKASIDEMERSGGDLSPYLYILQASYNSQTVFIFGNCCPHCNSTIPVKDCEGKVLFSLSEEGRERSLSNKNVIWQAGNCKCNFL